MANRFQGLHAGRSVLVVDDDPTTRKTIRLVLGHTGFCIQDAATGEAAIAAARTHAFDLALLDHRLPGISGLDVARTLQQERRSIPWILYSGCMDVELATKARRLGAIDALALPFDIGAVVASAFVEIVPTTTRAWPSVPLSQFLPDPGSSSERLACTILKACDAEDDPRTLTRWAASAASSRSSITDLCRILDIAAHDARDFTRVLRVLCRGRGNISRLRTDLLIGDDRTLTQLLRRAGVRGFLPGPISPGEFIAAQVFIARNHPSLSAVSKLLQQCAVRPDERGRTNASTDRIP